LNALYYKSSQKEIQMLQDLKDMIAACEKNIVTYKEMGDEEAVKAAESMKEKFEEIYQFELDEHIKEVTK
jgi:hypothetical protein